ncbi:MAG: GNAT family N-acetyltransferase [Nitrosomonadaceae bacterium]
MFHKVSTSNEIIEVVKIAREIWREHYPPIIGIEQVEYMLEHFHSKDAITLELTQENYAYYLIKNNNKKIIGYIGIQLKPDSLFLSKIYIRSSERGTGAGKASMSFIKDLAQKNNKNRISLTVNKNNIDSIAAYYRLGFIKTGDVCVDIGGGYEMDDFQMELNLS